MGRAGTGPAGLSSRPGPGWDESLPDGGEEAVLSSPRAYLPPKEQAGLTKNLFPISPIIRGEIRAQSYECAF